MNLVDHLKLMATYNQWMNEKIYAAAAQLSEGELKQDRQAFFPSIFATLSHLAVADTIWLRRFAAHPRHFPALEAVRRLVEPTGLDQLLFDHLPELYNYRIELDRIILSWVNGLSMQDVDQVLSYANTKGVVSRKSFYFLMVHFFNHQTHHRGQASTLLKQAGVDVGVTDLLAIIPNING